MCMEKVLVTGGSGTLGREVVDKLLSQQYETSILTSKENTVMPRGCRIYIGDLEKNTGLKEALENIDIIIHCASNPQNSLKVDIEGTKNLINATNRNRISRIIYISIVGVVKSDYPYYKTKVAVENMIKECGIPFTILRTTQFHNLILNIINGLERINGIINVPEGMKFQSIDVGEVAGYLVEMISEDDCGLLQERGGPEILGIEEMVKSYLEVSGLKNTFKLCEIKNERNDMFSSGINLCPSNNFGKITWRQFLRTLPK